MPELYSHIDFKQGTKAEYLSLDTIDANAIYFLTDTKQIFIGDTEYTKSATTLSEKPTLETEGEEGRIYICTVDGSSYAYIGGRWVTIYDPSNQVVKNITSGDTIECNPNPIVSEGTISHGTPEGAEQIVANTTEVQLEFGNSFNIDQIETDKFGHVVNLQQRNYKLPGPETLSTVFKYKGTLDSEDLLPVEGNMVGDVYYVIDQSSEYVYLETGWEKLGPIVDLSGLIPKVPNNENKVAMFTEDGSLTSAGYDNISGVIEGTYDTCTDNAINIAKLNIDKYGRVTSAENQKIKIASKELVADSIHWVLEQYLH